MRAGGGGRTALVDGGEYVGHVGHDLLLQSLDVVPLLHHQQLRACTMPPPPQQVKPHEFEPYPRPDVLRKDTATLESLMCTSGSCVPAPTPPHSSVSTCAKGLSDGHV